MHIFLSGPMGAGKSTVGPLLAARLGLRFRDLDDLVAQATGKCPASWIREHGEGALRDVEGRILRNVLAEHEPMVLALGGGTVTVESTRRALLRAGTLLSLHASSETLAARLRPHAEERRPLLRGGTSLQERIDALWKERLGAYAECHAWVRHEGAPEEAAEEAEVVLREKPVLVPLGRDSYRVRFARTGSSRLPALVPLHDPLRKGWDGRLVVVVCDQGTEPIGRLVMRAIATRRRVGIRLLVLPSGSDAKSLESLRRIWETSLEAGADRDTLLLAVGGGAVGDVTAFAAGTLLRGVGLLHVPTTLLAMADSAIGGKAAVDLPSGKNLVGIYHHPIAVLVDVDLLRSLPRRERIGGLAEIVKAAWIEGEEAVATLEREVEALHNGDPEAIERAIRMALSLKARLVAEDERDRGARHLLNLGHTLGHAIEAASGFRRVRHGEAVALGLMGAMRVGRSLGTATEADAERLHTLLGRLGLPVDLDTAWSTEAVPFLRRDKKRRGERIRFVLPGPPGCVELRELEPEAILRAAGLAH